MLQTLLLTCAGPVPGCGHLKHDDPCRRAGRYGGKGTEAQWRADAALPHPYPSAHMNQARRVHPPTMLPHRWSIHKGDTTMPLNRTLKMGLLLVVGIATIAVGLARSAPYGESG